MRIAKHVNDGEIFEIPISLSKAEIENLKRVTEKGTYKCAFCDARLRIESGDVKGTYFSHYKDESCIANASKLEKTYFTYKNQIKREEPKQQVVVSLLKNELDGLTKIFSELKADLGFNDSTFQTHVPDIVVELGKDKKKYAMSVVTRINKETDLELAESLKKRKQYFIKLGYEPIWFIERSHEALEYESQEIVFWESEKVLLQQCEEDKLWTRFLKNLTPSALHLTKILGLKKPLKSLTVQSIIYLSPKDNGKFLLYRFIEEIGTNPCRAYYLNEPYEMTMAEALSIHGNQFLFARIEKEEKGRGIFSEKYNDIAETLFKAELEVRKAKREKDVKEKENLNSLYLKANKQSEVHKPTSYQEKINFPNRTNIEDFSVEATNYRTYLNYFSLENELEKMNDKEQSIFNNLTKKYRITRENYPGICKLELKRGKYIHTPFTVWQLWIIDQILTTFQTSPLTAKTLYHTFRQKFRFDYKFISNWEFILYEYLLLLEDIGILKRIYNSNKLIDTDALFSVQLDTLPLIKNFKSNSFIAFYHSQYFNEDSLALDEAKKTEIRKVNEEYNAYIRLYIK